MTNEEICKWEPINKIPSQLYLQDLHNSDDGLKIELSQENLDLRLCIKFGSALAFQFTDEASRLRTLNTNEVLTSPWPLFITHTSSYINWLIDQGLGTVEKNQLIHYIITAGEGIIDIVSRDSPKVSWI